MAEPSWRVNDRSTRLLGVGMIGAASFMMRQQQKQEQEGQQQVEPRGGGRDADDDGVGSEADSGSDYAEPAAWRPAFDRTRTGLHTILSPTGRAEAAEEYDGIPMAMSAQRPLRPAPMTRRISTNIGEHRGMRTIGSSFALRSSLWDDRGRSRVCPCLCRPRTAAARARSDNNACESCFGTLPPGYTMRQQVSIVLSGTPFGHAWDTFQTVLSVAACGLYVGATYSMHVPQVRPRQQRALACACVPLAPCQLHTARLPPVPSRAHTPFTHLAPCVCVCVRLSVRRCVRASWVCGR